MFKGSKKQQVMNFWEQNKKLSIKEIAKKLDMHYATVRHALKDKIDLAKQTKKSTKKTKLNEQSKDVLRVIALRQGDISVFCPQCGKAARAHICSATLVGEHYELTAYGTCERRGCNHRWVMYNVKKHH